MLPFNLAAITVSLDLLLTTKSNQAAPSFDEVTEPLKV